MKYHRLIYVILISISSCALQKTEEERAVKSFDLKSCPENGSCIVELMENTILDLQKDGVGKFFTREASSDSHDLYKITFERKQVDERIMDAQYKEVVYFQLPKNTKRLDLKDNALGEVELVYGRLCFCPNQTGYQRIQSGSFSYTSQKDTAQVDIQLQPEDWPITMDVVELGIAFGS